MSRARFRGQAPAGEGNHIDNAVERVLAAGLVYASGPLTAALRLRYLGPRALDTRGTVRSRAATLLNLGVRHAVDRHLTLGLDLFNLAGRQDNDIEYLYASCTAGEVARGTCDGGIEGRHIHPVEPRSARVSARWTF